MARSCIDIFSQGRPPARRLCPGCRLLQQRRLCCLHQHRSVPAVHPRHCPLLHDAARGLSVRRCAHHGCWGQIRLVLLATSPLQETAGRAQPPPPPQPPPFARSAAGTPPCGRPLPASSAPAGAPAGCTKAQWSRSVSQLANTAWLRLASDGCSVSCTHLAAVHHGVAAGAVLQLHPHCMATAAGRQRAHLQAHCQQWRRLSVLAPRLQQTPQAVGT